ncbi:SMR domain-containing protein At5g58720 [Dendrobium catenatum]|uniref:SMR domain-containing protein At5g58720 n=1 Tax=Dendrobium catenatum TaxID=906689 RepID=UPI0009F427CB|nr:SMR domain-containing protein At5g58720 [Dendrobium catenatum]
MMKPSKTRKKKSKIKADPSPTYPNSPESVIVDAGAIEEIEDDGKRALDWLISAFPSLSLDQIDSAYKEAGGDAYKAAGILGAELVDPGENHGSTGKKRSAPKQKRIAASTGMISGIIGKDYSKSASSCSGGRGWVGPMEMKKRAFYARSSEEAEEFLCSMLGSDSELGMGVVRDVLSQCGYDLQKALDFLLDTSKISKERNGVDHMEVVFGEQRKGDARNSEIYREMWSKDPSKNKQSSFRLTDKSFVETYHSSAKEQDILQCVGSGSREYLKVPLNTKEQVPSKFGMVNPNLQQKVLESLFNVPEMSCVLNSMSWKEVVKKVESFGQGLEFGFEGVSEPSSGSRVGKEDYHAFRSVAKKNWDTMRSYYHKATLAYARGERAQASYLSEKGKFFKKLAQEADEKASQEIFAARNKGIKNTIVIDLHGQHVKQAIRLLKLHLLLCTYITSVHFLRVITGCGADGVGLGKLKQAVLNLARKEVINCNEENSGTLLLCLEGRRSFTFMESDVDSDENKP